MEEWKVLSAAWRAEQKKASAASQTSNYWTNRDDDAYRILKAVTRRLIALRIAEAREDGFDTRWNRKQLRGDRAEWQKLVVEVPPEMPGGR